jgi:hypothetical protein
MTDPDGTEEGCEALQNFWQRYLPDNDLHPSFDFIQCFLQGETFMICGYTAEAY